MASRLTELRIENRGEAEKADRGKPEIHAEAPDPDRLRQQPKAVGRRSSRRLRHRPGQSSLASNVARRQR